MKYKFFENQLFPAKSWNGMTRKNHLIEAYGYDPTYISQKIVDLLAANEGPDFVSMVMSHGTYTIPRDKDKHQWYLKTDVNENFELLGCYEDRARTRTIGTTAGLKPGANGTSFYMEFENKPFSVTQTIVGHKPNLYKLWIKDDPTNIGGNRWLYEVTLITNNKSYFIPTTELLNGTFWSDEGGLVPAEFSYTGQDIRFKSNAMLEAGLTQFRLKHSVPGNMWNVKPLQFMVNGKNGPTALWITNVEYEFMKKIRDVTAQTIMWGVSNIAEDGTIMNVDKNGNPAVSSSGWYEQWSSTNLHTWSVEPDLDFLTQIALDAVVGKVDWSKRRMVVKAGEYGLKELSKMVQRQLGSSAYTALNHLKDTTGRAYSWKDNEITAKLGQFMGVAVINGISFYFMIDPSKDDLKRNKIMHPKGGPASSYEYDIMGFGGTDEQSNMQIVRRESEAPIYGVEEGMRGFFNGPTSFNKPKQVTTPVDASTIHYFEPGVGAVCWDPTKIIRYYTNLTV